MEMLKNYEIIKYNTYTFKKFNINQIKSCPNDFYDTIKEFISGLKMTADICQFFVVNYSIVMLV